jgi:hypothetical protein
MSLSWDHSDTCQVISMLFRDVSNGGKLLRDSIGYLHAKGDPATQPVNSPESAFGACCAVSELTSAHRLRRSR